MNDESDVELIELRTRHLETVTRNREALLELTCAETEELRVKMRWFPFLAIGSTLLAVIGLSVLVSAW